MNLKQRNKIKRAIKELNLSKPVSGILLSIAIEVDGYWADYVDALNKTIKELKSNLNVSRASYKKKALRRGKKHER